MTERKMACWVPGASGATSREERTRRGWVEVGEMAPLRSALGSDSYIVELISNFHGFCISN